MTLLLLEPFGIKRKACRQVRDALLHFRLHRCRFGFVNDRRDQSADLLHLRFLHATRGYCRSANAQSRRHERFVLIKRNRVFVDGDVRRFERLFRVLAGDSFPIHPDVDEHQVVVGAAGHETQTLFL